MEWNVFHQILFQSQCVKTHPNVLLLRWIMLCQMCAHSEKLTISPRDLTVIFTAILCWRIFRPVLRWNWSGFSMSGGSDIHYSIMNSASIKALTPIMIHVSVACWPERQLFYESFKCWPHTYQRKMGMTLKNDKKKYLYIYIDGLV